MLLVLRCCCSSGVVVLFSFLRFPLRSLSFTHFVACRYENDCIFDKFEIAVSNDCEQFVTGSYNGNFHVYNIDGTLDTTLKADKFAASKQTSRYAKPGSEYGAGAGGRAEPLDISRKVLHTSWHPESNAIALTCHDSVYVYTQQK